MSAEPQFDPDEPSIFDEEDEAYVEQKLREGEEAARQGRVVPHALVSDWLSRVGTPDATPMPPEWLKSSGRLPR